MNKDLQDEAQRPHVASEEILDEPETDKGKRRRRPVRHPMPENLETETVILEPEHKTCPCCGKSLQQIGEEVTEEFDMIPARLIRRRIVRPKYDVLLRRSRSNAGGVAATTDASKQVGTWVGHAYPPVTF